MGRTANPTTGFGGLVRALRLGQGLTQAEVGEFAGLTGGYVARVELNRVQPTADVVARLATARSERRCPR